MAEISSLDHFHSRSRPEAARTADEEERWHRRAFSTPLGTAATGGALGSESCVFPPGFPKRDEEIVGD